MKQRAQLLIFLGLGFALATSCKTSKQTEAHAESSQRIAALKATRKQLLEEQSASKKDYVITAPYDTSGEKHELAMAGMRDMIEHFIRLRLALEPNPLEPTPQEEGLVARRFSELLDRMAFYEPKGKEDGVHIFVYSVGLEELHKLNRRGLRDTISKKMANSGAHTRMQASFQTALDNYDHLLQEEFPKYVSFEKRSEKETAQLLEAIHSQIEFHKRQGGE